MEPNFAELAKYMLELKKLNSRKTQIAARLHIGRLIQFFGAMPVKEITDLDWGRFVVQEQTKKPGRTMFDDRKYMRMIMLHAFNEGYTKRRLRLSIPHAPCQAGKEVRDEEIERLLSLASKKLRFQIEIALELGLRLREMLYLKWERIDWEARMIRLLPQDTKTRRARNVPINPALYEKFLERQKELQGRSPYVFPSPMNAQKPQDDNKKAWHRLKRLAGVKARWHDLRHTCVTRLSRAGIKPRIVGKMLGMSPTLVLKRYDHVRDEEELWEASEKAKMASGDK